MALVSRISVNNYRKHSQYSVDIDPQTTLIVGPNGSGKTSIVEALYTAFQGSSFKTADSDAVSVGKDGFSVQVSMSDGTTRSINYDIETKKREFVVNGKIYKRLSYSHKIPIVLFEPNDLSMISGSPSRRRGFIDRMISQIEPSHTTNLGRYDRAMKQRNLLLKRDAHPNDLFAWNMTLSKYGSLIAESRQKYVGKLNEFLQVRYDNISATSDTVAIAYSFDIKSDNIQQYLLSHLDNNYERDKLLGYTTSGPHRDDVDITFNGKPAAAVCSRGENRSIVVAIKLIELDLIGNQRGEYPLLLLDDVLSELDDLRQKNIITKTASQQIITSTKAIKVPGAAINKLDR